MSSWNIAPWCNFWPGSGTFWVWFFKLSRNGVFSHLIPRQNGISPPRASWGPRGHDAPGGENPFCLWIRCENNPFLLSFKNHTQNVPLPGQKLHQGAIFQLDILKSGRNVFTLLCIISCRTARGSRSRVRRRPRPRWRLTGPTFTEGRASLTRQEGTLHVEHRNFF